MVKVFSGNDLPLEALIPSLVERELDAKGCVAFLLTECTPGSHAVRIGLAMARRLVEAEQDIKQLRVQVAAARAVFEACRHCGETEIVTVLGQARCKKCGLRRVTPKEPIHDSREGVSDA